MAISERKYEQMFREAQADAIRFRQERDAALGWIRAIGRLTTDEQVEVMCRGAIGGQVPPDTARLDALERVDASIKCSAVYHLWHVKATYGGYGSSAYSLREALDGLIESMVRKAKETATKTEEPACLTLAVKEPHRYDRAEFWLRKRGLWFERDGGRFRIRAADLQAAEVELRGSGIDFDVAP